MKLLITLTCLLCSLQLGAQSLGQISVYKAEKYTINKDRNLTLGCPVKTDAMIIYHSNILGLTFTGNNIHAQQYDAKEHLYVLCVKPAYGYFIHIIHPDFAVRKHQVEKLDKNEMTEYILNPKGSHYPKVNITTTPGKTSVLVDGIERGTTPMSDIEIEKNGWHLFKLKQEGYFTRILPKKIKAGSITTIHKRMYRKTIVNLNALYGFDTWGGEFGMTANNISLAIDYLHQTRNNYYPSAPELHQVPDNAYPVTRLDQQVAATDSLGPAYAVKLGFTIGIPVTARIHIGYAIRDIYSQKTYRANTNFSYTNAAGDRVNVARNGVVKGDEIVKEQLSYYLVGAQVSLLHIFNVLADYWYNKQQSEIVVGVGVNLFGR